MKIEQPIFVSLKQTVSKNGKLVFLFFHFFIFSFFHSSISAQKIILSPEFKISEKYSKAQIVGKTSEGVLVRKSGKDEVLELYSSNNLYLRNTRILDNEETNNTIIKVEIPDPERIVVYALETIGAKSFLKQIFYSPRLDNKGDVVLLDSFQYTKIDVARQFRFATAADGSVTNLVYQMPNAVKIYTTNFDSASNNILTLDISELKTMVRKVISSTSNITYILTEEALQENDIHRFKILAYKQGVRIAEQGFEVKERIFDQPRFMLDAVNNTLKFISLIDSKSDDKEAGSVGVYAINFSAETLLPNTEKTTLYSTDFIKRLTNQPPSQFQSLPKKLFTFKIHDVVLQKDGTALLFLESSYSNSQNVLVNRGSISMGMMPDYRLVSNYYANDIIVFSVDTANTVTDKDIIRKKQSSVDDYGMYLSYFLVNTGKEIKLLFLDGESSSEGVLIQQEKVGDRNFQPSTVLDNDEKRVIPVVSMGKQTGRRELVLPSFYRDNFRLIKILF